MQFLLTEKEYNNLLNKIGEDKQKLKDTLQRLCTDVANHKPIKFWKRKEAEVWGCILNKEDSGLKNMGYCDECPVQDDCPRDYKRWSK